MTPILAITRRELGTFLRTPSGYVITALFLFFTAFVYFVAAPLLVGSGFSQGQPASMHLFFQIGIWVFFVIGPAISMRAVSEELRSGTLETLMTAPVGEFQIILGKFFGAMAFLAIMLAPTLLFVFALELHGRPDYGELLCGYLGLLLVGSAYLASGILASTMTSSQVLAYITTIFLWMILLLATRALPQAAAMIVVAADQSGTDPGTFGTWLASMSKLLAAGDPVRRAVVFVDGLADSFSIVYFLTLTSVLLAVAARFLGLRRWP